MSTTKAPAAPSGRICEKQIVNLTSVGKYYCETQVRADFMSHTSLFSMNFSISM